MGHDFGRGEWCMKSKYVQRVDNLTSLETAPTEIIEEHENIW
jgi:hypothetical protein